MIDCVLSYSPKDSERVKPIVDALRRAGLTVWWRWRAPNEPEPGRVRAGQLARSHCVVVCWTRAALDPKNQCVLQEARFARSRGTLVNLALEPTLIPGELAVDAPLDLADSACLTTDPRWEQVVRAIRAMAPGASAPVPSPTSALTPPTPTPAPGAAVLTAPGPLSLDGLPAAPRPPLPWNRLATAAGALAMAALVAHNLPVLRSLCHDDSVRDACVAAGVEGVASRAEEYGWLMAEARRSPDDYRKYLDAWPQGLYADIAQVRLKHCARVTEVHWRRQDDALPLVMLGSSEPAPTRNAARELLAPAVRDRAEALCGIYGRSDSYRLLRVRSEHDGWRCDKDDGGWRCNYDGQVVCELEARATVTRDRCQ